MNSKAASEILHKMGMKSSGYWLDTLGEQAINMISASPSRGRTISVEVDDARLEKFSEKVAAHAIVEFSNRLFVRDGKIHFLDEYHGFDDIRQITPRRPEGWISAYKAYFHTPIIK